jgi:hypothetical protein
MLDKSAISIAPPERKRTAKTAPTTLALAVSGRTRRSDANAAPASTRGANGEDGFKGGRPQARPAA